MKLSHAKVEYIVVDADDLNELIRSEYGVDYEIMAAEELNGGVHEFSAEKREFDAYDLIEIDEFKKGNRYHYKTALLLDDLCNKGFIEPGEYLVRV